MVRTAAHIPAGRAMWGSQLAALRAIGTDAPGRSGAPAPTFPIAASPQPNQFAPPPLADRYPLIIGQALTVSYVSSVFRLCTTGYRLQYVDLLNELLEQDPHLYSVVAKRIFASANGRLEVTPSEAEEGSDDDKLAKKAADMVRKELARIPNISQSLAALLWAVYYGLSAAEIFWTKDSTGWHVERLGFIHSRRLSYPDAQTWALHVWDQGQVYGWQSPWGDAPTNSGTFGLRVSDFPGKFIVHAPQLRGDYPTRDGIGRETSTWALFKRVGARGAVDYLERFAKPLMDVSFTTTDEGKPREATKEDIELAQAIASSIGPGSSNYASHADSIKVALTTAEGGGSAKVTWPEWIQICNGEMSKAAIGGTLGTEVSHGGGNRALGEVQQRGEVGFEQYDGSTLAETIRRDIVTWLVRLNMPEALHVIPQIALHVDKDPEPKTIAELAKTLTQAGVPVDADALAEEVGIALIPNTNLDDKGKPKPRRTFNSDVVDPHTVDPSLMSEEAKAEKDEDRQNKQDVEMTKAKQPKVAPPGTPGAQQPAVAGAKATKAVPGKGKPPAKKTTGKGKPPAKRKLSDKPGEAAIVIVRDAVGNVLTVSRPEPPHEMAIPGGGVDDGETPEQAAIREINEETGVEVLSLERAGRLTSPEGTRVHVFLATEWQGNAHPAEPDTRVDWLTVDTLLEQASLFKAHIEQLINAGAFVDDDA